MRTAVHTQCTWTPDQLTARLQGTLAACRAGGAAAGLQGVEQSSASHLDEHAQVLNSRADTNINLCLIDSHMTSRWVMEPSTVEQQNKYAMPALFPVTDAQ